MAKKHTASKAQLKPDTRFNSELVSKFINCMMYDGKKATACRVFYGAMDIVQSKMKDINPVDVFLQAIENVKPTVEVRSRRVGGANYQVPMPVKSSRQQSLSMRWIIAAIRAKSGRPMFERLADEPVDPLDPGGVPGQVGSSDVPASGR
jgi:small subunit ribosomal protein S7